MDPRRRVSWNPPIALWLLGVMAFGLASTGALHGQCPWVTGPTCAPTGGGPYSMCSRILIPTDACNFDADGGMGTSCIKTTMSTFGTQVNLMAAQTMTSLQGSAFCEWGCGAETCRIQLSDGLPVELMDFSVGEPGQDLNNDPGEEED